MTALLVPKDEQKLPSDAELALRLKPILASYKSPRRIAWVKELPKTKAGKPDRNDRQSERGSLPDPSLQTLKTQTARFPEPFVIWKAVFLPLTLRFIRKFHGNEFSTSVPVNENRQAAFGFADDFV